MFQEVLWSIKITNRWNCKRCGIFRHVSDHQRFLHFLHSAICCCCWLKCFTDLEPLLIHVHIWFSTLCTKLVIIEINDLKRDLICQGNGTLAVIKMAWRLKSLIPNFVLHFYDVCTLAQKFYEFNSPPTYLEQTACIH